LRRHIQVQPLALPARPFPTMATDLMGLLGEVIKALTVLMQALAMLGVATSRQAMACGLHGLRRLVPGLTERVIVGGQDTDPRDSQSPFPRPPTQADPDMAAPVPIVTAVPMGPPFVTMPMDMDPVPMVAAPMAFGPTTMKVVFITEANFKQKTGKYHYTSDCDGLGAACSTIMPYFLDKVMAIKNLKFALCLKCQKDAA
jgi:hypothetical protein